MDRGSYREAIEHTFTQVYLVMAKSHCTCTCIKSSKEYCVLCVKPLQDCVGVYKLWRFEIWESQFNSHTIITVWWRLSPSRYILQLPLLLEFMLAIIYKALWSSCFYFSLYIFLLRKPCMGIYEREKKYLMMLSIWVSTVAMPKHTNVISWLAGNNGEMVIYEFLLKFSSPSYQKEWYEC